VGGDGAGFVDGQRGGVRVAVPAEVLGVVEQAVREVVRGAVLAQAGDGGGEGARGGLVAVALGLAGAGQVRSARSMGARCPGWYASSTASNSAMAAVSA